MAALANEYNPPQTKRRTSIVDDSALAFINSLESSWKGHEPLAFWLVQHLRPKTVVDLGFDKGFSTLSFAYKNKGHVFGIDWFDEGNYAAKCFALDSAYRNISNAIRFHYAKNIHLIVGPFKDVSKNWNRKIDILHLACAPQYAMLKEHYENWSRFISEDGVILVHDVTAYPKEAGRFFEELSMEKVLFAHAKGLGIASKNGTIIEEIKKKFSSSL